MFYLFTLKFFILVLSVKKQKSDKLTLAYIHTYTHSSVFIFCTYVILFWLFFGLFFFCKLILFLNSFQFCISLDHCLSSFKLRTS